MGCFFGLLRRQPSSDESPPGLLADAGMARYTISASSRPFPFSFSKRQKICRKISKIVKIHQHSKNIENKLKYFKKCVDKCTTLYYIKLNKRETEQPNREGWERREKYKRIYRKRGIVHLTSKVLPQSSMMYN